MPCYHPLPAWRSRRRENGKRRVVFRLDEADKGRPVEIPCGTCIGCQLERSRQWAVRCEHEARLHDDSCFVTLTYDPEHLPAGGTLVPSHLQDFLKRLRWHNGERRIRFFACGEYGESLSRPHYHALLFNYAPPDQRPYTERDGVRLYQSRSLDELWGHGLCSVGAVTFESAAYVARYALKKVVGPAAEAHYQGRHPEFLRMSRRPGIGRKFVERYRREIYRDDSVITRGVECRPPRYYDNVEEKLAPSVLAKVKAERRAEAARAAVEAVRHLHELGGGSRNVVREEVKKAAVSHLVRGIER